jgi:hypothetical protein
MVAAAAGGRAAAYQAKKRRDEEERRRLADQQGELEKLSTETVRKYAGEGATAMTHEQFKDCLADYAYDFQVLNKTLDPSLACQDMAPMAPTDEETLYVMKMATLDGAEGLDGNPDEAVSFECTISAAQLHDAVSIWGSYLMLRGQIEDVFEQFDTDKSGKLDPGQLKEYMMSVCDAGDPDVTDADVKWLLDRADVVRDGQIERIEYILCSTVWMREVVKRRNKKRKKSTMCSIL